MTAVLPRTRSTADRPRQAVPPAPSRRVAVPDEPVDRRARYWDVAAAAWRPSPVEDGG